MTRLRLLTLLTMVAVLLLSGCGGREPADQPTVQATTPETAAAVPTRQEEAEATSAPMAAPTATPAPTPEPATPTPEELTLSSLTEGLGALKSYKSEFSMHFSGKDADGKDVSHSWDTLIEFTREPLAQRLVVITEGDEQSPGRAVQFEMISIGDTMYWVGRDDADEVASCMTFSSSDTQVSDEGIFTPDMVGGIGGARYIGTATVNGVRTRHYRWTESDMGFLGFGSASGDVWVAQNEQVVVKYEAEYTGSGTGLGFNSAEGTVKATYNLIEFNTDFQIEPPEGCEAPTTDIPLMADAGDRASMGSMITYSSPSALEDVAEFYKAEMPKFGWEMRDDPSDYGTMIRIVYLKDGRQANVTLAYSEDDEKTTVIITTVDQ